MSEPTVQRTLVKSPPELWAELSDVESLARHLGEFGEIRITRVEPETTVVWEGERASGTVELEPSGWGTRVTLTASPVAEPEPVVAPNVPIGGPETSYRDAREDVEPEALAPEVLAVAPAPAPVTANEMLARSGFFARMFRKRKAEIGGPSAPTPEPSPPMPGPAQVPDPPAPDPEPDPPAPEPTPLPPRPEPEPPAAAEAAPPLDVQGVLAGVLDTLGQAHHRPFSR